MMKTINRRDFLKQAGLGMVGAGTILTLPGRLSGALRTPPASTAEGEHFSFIHFTDTHVQTELNGHLGMRKAVEKMNQIGAAFAIHGGDIVFDVFETDRRRADFLYKLYRDELAHLKPQTYHVIGNHDVFGISPKSGVRKSDPEYGKRMFMDYLGEGRTYRSFDYGRWHFILLDSIDITSDRSYRGLIDYEQFEWLKADLQETGKDRPIVIVTHIPLITLFWQIVDARRTPIPPGVAIVNAKKVWELIEPYNVRAVLQGHLHIREKLEYNGVQYITSGAVCGNWWKGPRMGHPEGFAVIEVRGDELTWRYETYGWKAAVTESDAPGH